MLVEPRDLVVVAGDVFADERMIGKVGRDDGVRGLVRGGDGVGIERPVRVGGGEPQEEGLRLGAIAQSAEGLARGLSAGTFGDVVPMLPLGVSQVPLAHCHVVVARFAKMPGKGMLLARQGHMQVLSAGLVRVAAGEDGRSRRAARRDCEKSVLKYDSFPARFGRCSASREKDARESTDRPRPGRPR